MISTRDPAPHRSTQDLVLEIRGVSITYPGGRQGVFGHPTPVRAVAGMNLTLARGATLGIVGESGSGKSSIGRYLVRLLPPGSRTDGSAAVCGVEVGTAHGATLRALRRRVQMVFQDPSGSLNPRRKVGRTIGDALTSNTDLRGEARTRRIAELLSMVGLDERFANRRPHEFSGGQRQRIAIATALAAGPEVLVCDEPIAALDVSVQAQVLNLLMDLQRDLGLSIVFISHDINAVRHVSDNIAVMYLGALVEYGPADEVYQQPRHPYTSSLIAATPNLHPVSVPSGASTPLRGEAVTDGPAVQGCQFRPRCWLYRQLDSPARCREAIPDLVGSSTGHLASCHFVDAIADRMPPAPRDETTSR